MRARTPAAVTACLLLATPALLGASTQGDEDDVTQQQRQESIHGITPKDAVAGIDPKESIEPLDKEDVEGSTTTVTISTDVLFEFDKASLNTKAKDNLQGVAEDLEGVSGTVEVVGHTDGKGEDSYNEKLSEKRADAVTKALEDELGADAPEFEASGKGSEDPVADEETSKGKDDPAGRSKNRRVEISFEGG